MTTALPAVVPPKPRYAQADDGADYGDEQALHQEDSADLVDADAEAHQYGDVLGFLHDHHGEGDQDVQGRNADDQREDDEGHDLLQPQRSEDLAVLLHPVGRLEAFACGLFDLLTDFGCAVHVVNLEADGRDEVRFGEELLRIGEPDECVAGVVLIEARLEDASYPITLIFRHDAKWAKVALWTCYQHAIADDRTHRFGEVLSDDNGGQGCGRVPGRILGWLQRSRVATGHGVQNV